jgi:hypothetical protein
MKVQTSSYNNALASLAHVFNVEIEGTKKYGNRE